MASSKSVFDEAPNAGGTLRGGGAKPAGGCEHTVECLVYSEFDLLRLGSCLQRVHDRALACLAIVSACSGSAGGLSAAVHSASASNPAPGGHVSLVPVLGSVGAGWCIAAGVRSGTKGSSGCGWGARTSTGPIFAEGGCQENETRTFVFVLTTSEVAAVAVDGGAPIATFSNATLPDGLRAAAVELLGHEAQPKPGVRIGCPRLTPLDASGRPILRKGRPGAPLFVRLPRRDWEAPQHPARGACEITVAGLPPGTVSAEGEVASRIRAVRGLLGHAFLTCATTVYIYVEEHHLPSGSCWTRHTPARDLRLYLECGPWQAI